MALTVSETEYGLLTYETASNPPQCFDSVFAAMDSKGEMGTVFGALYKNRTNTMKTPT